MTFCLSLWALTDDRSARAGEPLAAVAASKAPPQSDGPVALIEVAPELLFTAKRYSKFFGDPNTRHGELFERSALLGDLGGVRDVLIDNGLFLDLSMTQFLQGNVRGGDQASPKARYSGSADLWMWFDTGKADLWSGGALFAHGESRWNEQFNDDVGSLLPANSDAVMPNADPSRDNFALSEYYVLQSLPLDLLAAVGKVDMAAWADTNMFANQERAQFNYTGLINNAIAGVFFPYTTYGAWLTWSPSKTHTLTAVYAAADDSANNYNTDVIFNGNEAYAFQYIFATEIASRPGRYLLAAAHSTKDIRGFDISSRFGATRRVSLLEDLVLRVPVLNEQNENSAVFVNFAQYLWVEDGSVEAFNRRLDSGRHAGLTHHNDPPAGIGIFGRAGWAPKDRNTIDQFYSLGIGGYGALIPGRDDDQWGIGWAGTHISSDLRDLPSGLRSWEHGFEGFYNFALTPAAHFSVNAQVIRPANEFFDTALTLGARLQLDF